MGAEIKEFIVEGLFGMYQCCIKFDEPIKIVVGENGSGKTTIINMLYYTLAENELEFRKLRSFDFKSITLVFNGEESKLTFTKEQIVSDGRYPLVVNRLFRVFGYEKTIEIIKQIQENELPMDIHILEQICRIPYVRIKRQLNVLEVNKFTEQDRNIHDQIQRRIKSKILYLPTYRRIENDFESLDLKETLRNTVAKETGLNFGMQDVKERLDEVIEKINITYRTGFSKISVDILNDIAENKNMRGISLENEYKLIEIIDRLEDVNFSAERKQSVKEYIKSHDKKEMEEKGYNYFLNKLLTLYAEQQVQEEKIDKFRTVCNKYLVNKEFVFNNTTLEYWIQLKECPNKQLEFEDLSSGEKQIIALFSCLYLDDKNEYYLFFDEPELSLSIEWQRMLLVDVWESERCKLLFVTTHSPFIFDNKLDKYAVSLENFMEEYCEKSR